MAKRKRSADDLEGLVVEVIPPLFAPFIGWDADIRSILRWRPYLSVLSLVITATMCGLLLALVPNLFPRFSETIVYDCLFWMWVIGTGLGFLLIQCAFNIFMFARGVAKALRSREPGAPKKWTPEFCKETVAAVQAVVAEKRLGIARSIDILKRRDPERWESLSEPRYYEAVRKLKKPTA